MIRGIILVFISSFLLGIYLILQHNDYWIGIPLTAFGSTLIVILVIAFIHTIKIWIKRKQEIEKLR